jgi:TolA-binding protein
MKKALLLSLALLCLAAPALAETDADLKAKVQQLEAQVAALNTQVEVLLVQNRKAQEALAMTGERLLVSEKANAALRAQVMQSPSSSQPSTQPAATQPDTHPATLH